jgi:hypothetical protein
MVKIVATESRLDCVVTSEGGSEEDTFFNATIAVYDALNPSCTSEEIVRNFLVEIVNYMVDRECEWIDGDVEKSEQQDRCLKGVIAALECLLPCVRGDIAIKKAKTLIE